ncbi:hypothetical protein LVD15_08065 [Fulvivirga maritima]|uniref:hypothetical protein n=1 Tax=Fulvivirga maritima TaxID=2904247 RepID=UPI001F1EB4C3|nr:hypothetical protein [Fulvivirga maritima]UII28372.1 hypothetical protein LVD15_08065 [Fulvivirga maritima]
MENTLDTVKSESNVPVMTVKDWLLTFLVMMVPVVNIIMMFVWAFGDNTNKNKANWAKAGLILSVIIFGIYLIFFALFGAAFFLGNTSY